MFYLVIYRPVCDPYEDMAKEACQGVRHDDHGERLRWGIYEEMRLYFNSEEL